MYMACFILILIGFASIFIHIGNTANCPSPDDLRKAQMQYHKRGVSVPPKHAQILLLSPSGDCDSACKVTQHARDLTPEERIKLCKKVNANKIFEPAPGITDSSCGQSGAINNFISIDFNEL